VFTSIRLAAGKSPILVVPVFAQDKRPFVHAEDERRIRDHGAGDELTALLQRPDCTGSASEITLAGGSLLLVGLGPSDTCTTRTWRNAGAALLRALHRLRAEAMRPEFSGASANLGAEVAAQSLAEGMGLANWRVDFFRGTASEITDPLAQLSIQVTDRAARRGFESGLLRAACTNESRRLAVTPPNICHPAWMASESRRLAKKAGLSCRVISYADAQKRGMGGIVNVGKGSAVKPCMIVLEHKPARVKKGVRLALVGKTMTYDTGGYSLKLSGGMKGMKYDGNGGCAVLGAMLAIAAMKLPVHVVALLPCAENMVSSDSYRPDDIITMYNGATVEVTNTDAEGRLILADALTYACRDIKATHIVDTATLTGGVVVALGSWCAGFFCNDDALRRRLETASDHSDERIWRLPLWSEHRDFMRSNHADLWNSGPKRDGHPIQGAAFLSYFVDDNIPWAHVDIAGTSAVDSDSALYVTGPTGFGVRLLTDLAASFT